MVTRTKLTKKYRVADIGYGYLKFLVDSGIVEKRSSVVAELGDVQSTGSAKGKRLHDVIKVDNVNYVVGESVYRLGLTPITASESAKRADNIAYKVLGLYALAKVYESDEETITLLTGLPYQNFKNQDEIKAVEDLFQKSHVIEFNGREMNIDIDEVLVVSQGVGACYTLSAQRPKDYLSKRMLLADLGFNTVNYIPIHDGSLNMDKIKTNRDLGIQAAYKKIVDWVNIEFNENFKYYEIDSLLDNGVPVRNGNGEIEPVSIIDHPFVQDQFKGYAEQVWNDIFDKHETTELRTIEEVVFSGGTAERVGKHLLEVRNFKSSIIEDPQEAQVKGYAEIALQVRLSRGE